MNDDELAPMFDTDEDCVFEPTETCWRCAGDGCVHDCGEDCCCCLDPTEDFCFPCDECCGTGRAFARD